MNIGFVGLGKLGLPCALAIDSFKEHNVIGYDPDERIPVSEALDPNKPQKPI